MRRDGPQYCERFGSAPAPKDVAGPRLRKYGGQTLRANQASRSVIADIRRFVTVPRNHVLMWTYDTLRPDDQLVLVPRT